MGSGEATVIKLNNKESPAEEGDNDGDEDNERIRDNGGGGAEDWVLVDLEQRVPEEKVSTKALQGQGGAQRLKNLVT